jgi:hypothetical protein
MRRTLLGSFLGMGVLHCGATTLFCVADNAFEWPGPET